MVPEFLGLPAQPVILVAGFVLFTAGAAWIVRILRSAGNEESAKWRYRGK
jgi:hypothetical protein